MEPIFYSTEFTTGQLIEKIDTGELGLPELQRPFVWKNTKVRDLFDSMMSVLGISSCSDNTQKQKMTLQR